MGQNGRPASRPVQSQSRHQVQDESSSPIDRRLQSRTSSRNPPYDMEQEPKGVHSHPGRCTHWQHRGMHTSLPLATLVTPPPRRSTQKSTTGKFEAATAQSRLPTNTGGRRRGLARPTYKNLRSVHLLQQIVHASYMAL